LFFKEINNKSTVKHFPFPCLFDVDSRQCNIILICSFK